MDRDRLGLRRHRLLPELWTAGPGGPLPACGTLRPSLTAARPSLAADRASDRHAARPLPLSVARRAARAGLANREPCSARRLVSRLWLIVSPRACSSGGPLRSELTRGSGDVSYAYRLYTRHVGLHCGRLQTGDTAHWT